MTTNRPELTFDGCGINGPDEYRTRLATFTRCYWDKEAKKYGPLFAAAPELLEAAKSARKYWGTLHDIVSDLIERGAITEAMIPDDYQALVVTLEAAALDADAKTEQAIAKAEGKSND